MTYSQRRQTAIESVRLKRDEARDAREWDDEERTQRTLDDQADTARNVEANPLSELSCTPPGVRRAQASVRAMLRERDDGMTDQDELDAAFGSDDDSRDDEEDFVA